MTNEELINRCRNTELPADLADAIEQLISAAAALRSRYPADKVYEINFGERSLLRELLAPDDHDSHWWQTGLYIIRHGIATHAALQAEFGTPLEHLEPLLESRLGPYDEVALREINTRTVTGICLLSELMEYPQNTFVAPNAYSLAEALFHDTAWYRAVYAGKSPVGFIMLDDNADKPEYYLWRFMIAPPFQRRGYGAAAIQLLLEYVRARPGSKELLVSYIRHEAGPAEFYRGLGFSETGNVEDGEVEMSLKL